MTNSIQQLQWRYAVKKFDDTKNLTSDKIQILKEAFNLTATSYGLQPIKLVVINNKELQNSLVKASYNQRQVAQASHVLVFCIETQISEQYILDYFSNVKKLRNTADEILHPFKTALIRDFSQKTKDQIISWATNQAYLAMGNLLTICALEEIDACPMEGFIASEYHKILDLEDKGLQAVLVLPVGYRAEDDFFSNLAKVRKSVEDCVIEL
jgi:nitroreductase